MCTPLACSDYYETSASPHTFSRRRAYPTNPNGFQAKGTARDDSRVHCEPIDQRGIQLCPATSSRVRRSPSSQPPHRHRKPATESTSHYGRLCVAPRPISARFEPVPRLRSFTAGSSRIPSDLARRTRPVWQCQTVPALSALLAILPGIPRVRLRSAPAKLLRQLDEKVLHLLRFSAPHGALRLHGAG
jgi:hypothetical protein